MGKSAIEAHVGANIRKQRNAQGLTLPTLAGKLGFPHQQLQGYETGRVGISASTAYHIAAALEIDVRLFFEGLEFNPDIEQVVEVNWSSIRAAEAMSRIKDPELRALLTTLAGKLRDGHF